MKLVHDILFGTFETGGAIPIGIVQWGNSEEGYQYEIVCPFCASSIEWLPSIPKYEVGKLIQLGMTAMVGHRISCTRWGHRFDIRKTDRPLNTEKLPTVN